LNSAGARPDAVTPASPGTQAGRRAEELGDAHRLGRKFKFKLAAL
jgi:hypothetical protein